MNRLFIVCLLLCLSNLRPLSATVLPDGSEDRAFWVATLTRIADPVLLHLSQNTLKANLPFESTDQSESRKVFAPLEAVGRLLSGISPWLELGPDETEEGRLREKYIHLTLAGLKHAVDPEAPDFLEFAKPYQPLVDAAFLAQGLLRARTQLWERLDRQTRERMISALKKSRQIKPWENNWLLFASMVEAALLEFTGECDVERLKNGVERFGNEWYKGDALYGDGPAFHMDYYNSFVIHPMLTEVLLVMSKHGMDEQGFSDKQVKRLGRYADLLERFISPEGTFPIVGRSITYRTGVFHALSLASLLEVLPGHLEPAQVRCALTAVINRQFESPANFDENGWLRNGFTGSQINMSESYINTGSLYLCSTVFLPLGLPVTHPFWNAPYMEWTNKKGWKGETVKRDAALKD